WLDARVAGYVAMVVELHGISSLHCVVFKYRTENSLFELQILFTLYAMCDVGDKTGVSGGASGG
ncbi:MAG TPA: hypothetical protein VJQ60_00415, partial [Arthrobacter sp.]|nr:hypothetical protein [Arthrobacter sp.]